MLPPGVNRQGKSQQWDCALLVRLPDTRKLFLFFLLCQLCILNNVIFCVLGERIQIQEALNLFFLNVSNFEEFDEKYMPDMKLLYYLGHLNNTQEKVTLV